MRRSHEPAVIRPYCYRRIAYAALAVTAFTVAAIAMPASAAAGTLWLPLTANDHPLGLCPAGLTEVQAIGIALNRAEIEGFGPSPGAIAPDVLLLERLTAARADAKYGLGLTTGTPQMRNWECVWVVELSGRMPVVDGRPPVWTPTPGPPPPPVYWDTMGMVIHDTEHTINTLWFSRPADPDVTPLPTRDVTPDPRPTRPFLTPTPARLR